MLLRNKILLFIISAILLFVVLVGCIKKADLLPLNNAYKEVQNKEDTLIMEGFNALDSHDFKKAQEIFTKAYAYYPNPSYLKEILGILMLQGNFNEAKQKAESFLQKYPDDAEVRQVLVGILTNLKDYKEALKVALDLVESKKSAQNYELLSSVYFLQQDYKNAAKYLKIAYDDEKSEALLNRLAATHLLFLRDVKSAVLLYESHIKTQGISKGVGEKLGSIYMETKAYKKALKLYSDMFLEFGEQNYAKNVVEIYFQTQNLNGVKQFLQKNPKVEGSDVLLFEVYRLQRDYKNSIKQAELLYQKNGDANFLAFSAMMRYEVAKKHTKESLADIEADLEKCAKESNDALYWNYLGYLMIDHDFGDENRLKKGVEFVKNALEIEPDNHYYLDSLAWGYYKLKDCNNAKEIMQKIPQDEINKEAELKEHKRKIMQCK